MLGLLPGAYTPQVQEAITRLGSRLTYGEAQAEMALMWKVTVSKSSVRQITLRHGQVADLLIDKKVAELEASAAVPTAQPQQLVMCADGAMVQLTTGEWREVKTVAFGEFRPCWDIKNRKVVTHTEQVSYFSRVDTADAFARSALLEWHRRGGENAERVVAVNDGALWIQAFIDYHCPEAVRVIDFAHAQAYVATVGRAIHGADTDAFRQWFAQMSRQLGQQPPQRTIAALRLLQRQHPNHPETETIDMAIRYLEKRVSLLDYPRFRRQQIPIGSGIGESGHKVVMQRRMKQAGMRWAEENLNPMLALRSALCNQMWTECWQAITTHIHEEKQAARLRKKPQAPSGEEKVEIVSEVDCRRLTALTKGLAKKKRTPWQDHRWIFLYRKNSIHKK